MKRREFITLLGGTAAWPLVARGQQAAIPVVGFLSSRWSATDAPYAAAFRQGLMETGYIDGQNITIEYRWAEGRNERLPKLANELINHPVAVIVGNSVSADAAKAGSATIPIVFAPAVIRCKGVSLPVSTGRAVI